MRPFLVVVVIVSAWLALGCAGGRRNRALREIAASEFECPERLVKLSTISKSGQEYRASGCNHSATYHFTPTEGATRTSEISAKALDPAFGSTPTPQGPPPPPPPSL